MLHQQQEQISADGLSNPHFVQEQYRKDLEFYSQAFELNAPGLLHPCRYCKRSIVCTTYNKV